MFIFWYFGKAKKKYIFINNHNNKQRKLLLFQRGSGSRDSHHPPPTLVKFMTVHRQGRDFLKRGSKKMLAGVAKLYGVSCKWARSNKSAHKTQRTRGKRAVHRPRPQIRVVRINLPAPWTPPAQQIGNVAPPKEWPPGWKCTQLSEKYYFEYFSLIWRF